MNPLTRHNQVAWLEPSRGGTGITNTVVVLGVSLSNPDLSPDEASDHGQY
jgi:hypothetical protein